MTYAVIFAADPSSLFTGAEGLLRYGPLGLAALLLVLVVLVLLLRKLDPSQESILKIFLYVGAFCFVAALVAQSFALPDAKLQEENIRLKAELKAERDRPPPDFSKQKTVLGNVVGTVGPSVAELDEINKMALDNGCPGGAHGIPIPHGGDIASRSSNVKANLENAKPNIEAVIQSLPGTH
jgi:hypothetical protein